MTTKHTPGPWKIVHTPTRKETFWAVCTTNDAPEQAVIALIDGKSKLHIEHPDYAEANAKLIAAAPDLLEVAQMAASSIKVDQLALMSAARVAIKKATGN